MSMTFGYYYDRNNVCLPCGKTRISNFGVDKKLSGEAKGAVGISYSSKVNGINFCINT